MDQLRTTDTLWSYFEVNELTLLFHPSLPTRKVNKKKRELACKPFLGGMLPLALMGLLARVELIG